MRFDKPTTITVAVLAVIVTALALFVPWKCSAQTAGTFNLSQGYTATQDAIMTSMYGNTWSAIIKAELLEHLKNRFSEAREQYRKKATDAVALPDEDADYLKPGEKTAVDNATNTIRIAADSIKARKAREAAAQQDIGMNRNVSPEGYIYAVNRPFDESLNEQYYGGKMLSPRLALLADIEPGTDRLNHGYPASWGWMALLYELPKYIAYGVLGYGVFLLAHWAAHEMIEWR